MTRKKEKTAPPATETSEPPQVEYTEPEVTAEQPQSPFPREEIEKAFNNPMLKGFKKYLDPLLTYFETVETRLQTADANFQKIGAFLERMEPLVKLGEQVQQRQTQASASGVTAPQQGLDVGSLLTLGSQLLGGSGGNPITDELTKKIIDAGLEQMTMGTTLLKAVEKKILTDMGAKVATEAIPK